MRVTRSVILVLGVLLRRLKLCGLFCLRLQPAGLLLRAPLLVRVFFLRLPPPGLLLRASLLVPVFCLGLRPPGLIGRAVPLQSILRVGVLSVGLLCACLLSPGAVADEPTPASRLSELLNDDSAADFARANVPRQFTFPRDHGPHDEFRNEWWYVTGNLDDDGRRFGFELTIFRFALTAQAPQAKSGWRTNQVYIAHLAVTDAKEERFYVATRFSRGALGLAGAQANPLRVWIDEWEIAASGKNQPWHIRAADDEIAVDLALTPLKEPTLNGDAGLSRKSSSTDSASYYYSITRLHTEGTISIAGKSYTVSGLSWLDREWSTSALAADQVGWDWFALQLSDGTDVMLYNLRKSDGTTDVASSGTLTFANGRSQTLRLQDFDILVNDTWKSPEGGTYPSNWQVDIPEQGLQLTIKPVMANQELITTVRYWEGAVDVKGQYNGEPVTGRGYVELTGYAD